MKDFLLFKRMVTPAVIQLVFWLLIALLLVSAVVSILRKDFLIGILTLVIGPLVVRIACEVVIVFFRIHDDLMAIRQEGMREKGRV